MASPWTRYLIWMLATSFATIAICGAFTAFIDPLGIFGSPRLAGINARKPYLDHHRALSRWQAARRACASAAIFGNSRAEIGLDPDHPAFQRRGLDAFNHAIPGSGVFVAYEQLSWLREAGCVPQVIVIGVDFFDFLDASTLANGRIAAAARPPEVDIRTVAETVFSITALRDSVVTVGLQRARHPAVITVRGFNPLLNYIPEVERHGQYALFRQRAMENLRTWARKAHRIRPADGGVSAEYSELEAFLAAASSTADEVHVVIYPYHAQLRLMMERAGLGDLFTAWKSSMLTTTRKFATRRSATTVWDFSAISEETTEPIPPNGDRLARSKYYWEAGHFTKLLGDRILGQILVNEPGFGVPMEEAMLDGWLAEDRYRVKVLLTHPSPLLSEVESLFVRQRAEGKRANVGLEWDDQRPPR